MSLLIIFLSIQLIRSPCPVSDTKCLRCGGDRCLNCADSYVNDSGSCVQVRTKIPNCITYDSFDSCLVCDYTFTVSGGVCVAIPPEEKCAQKDVNGDCKYCLDRRLMKDGVCNKDNNSCSTPNCKLCSNYFGLEQCELCKDNFMVYPYDDKGITKTRCVHENGRTVGCQVSGFEDERECLLCRVNYYFSEGKCIFSPDYTIDLVQFSGSLLRGVALMIFSALLN